MWVVTATLEGWAAIIFVTCFLAILVAMMAFAASRVLKEETYNERMDQVCIDKTGLPCVRGGRCP